MMKTNTSTSIAVKTVKNESFDICAVRIFQTHCVKLQKSMQRVVQVVERYSPLTLGAMFGGSLTQSDVNIT